LRTAAAGFAFTETQDRAEIEFSGDSGACFLAHQRVEGARELALVGLGQAFVQHVSNRKAEHPIAEKLQTLVGALGAAGG
jgi:hypothetical protein